MSDNTPSTTPDAAELEALRTENAALKAAADETARLEAVRGRNLPDEAAGMIPAGVVPAEWLNQYGAFLTPAAGAAADPDHTAEQAAQGRLGAVESAAQPAATDIEAQMDQAIAQGPQAFREFLRGQRAEATAILR